ncbi:hypothetical protein AVEN_221180-1 [Araneus ventricosus]|uniref:Uncharacterized protein n=1 Tax=Araneus ventricosus TaxID=182803 RepID=A0A4Y2I3T6_ARAVE|nr:hypothetical protein AVEN_221180-1 [Araneus ventricosus]
MRRFSLEKARVLQWMLAHVGIDGNETADQLAKDDRLLNNDSPYHLILFDAIAVAKSELRKPRLLRIVLVSVKSKTVET